LTALTDIEPPPIDMGLRLYRNADDPKKPLRLSSLDVGQRMHHREFGYGFGARFMGEKETGRICIDFDEAGPRWFACR
jgi:hypothetical protein